MLPNVANNNKRTLSVTLFYIKKESPQMRDGTAAIDM